MDFSDDRLIRQAANGDGEALSQLIERHGPALRNRFKNEIPQRWQAMLSLDDLMQETYTDAFFDIHGFVPRGEGSFDAWLATIAKHNLINAVEMLEAERRGGKRRNVGPRGGGDSVVALYELLNVTSNTPSREVAHQEARTAVLAAIEHLPMDYRFVVRTYDLEGRSVEEVSAELKRSPGAVFMLCACAHVALRRLMGSSSNYLSKLT